MDSTVKHVLKTILDETPIYIYGCGQRGRKVANCLVEMGANVKGFLTEIPVRTEPKWREFPADSGRMMWLMV